VTTEASQDPIAALNQVLSEVIDVVQDVKQAHQKVSYTHALRAVLDELFADLQSWVRLLVDQDEVLGVSPLSSMPSVAGRTLVTLWPGPATDEEVRDLVGQHLDELEHHVALALAEQDHDESRAVLAAVQRGIVDHQKSLREITADQAPLTRGAKPDSTTHDIEETEPAMARVLYTAEATVTGGRANGHGRTTDGLLDVQLRSPKEMGGEGDGTNPEQLFAVGYAACFEGALGVIGRRERAEVGDVSIDSRVSLLPTEERGFTIAVTLDVTLPQVRDPEQAVRIVAAAHQVCPYSNATRGNIDVVLTANGHVVG
jgi:Ohr subfamily peroxiredoxin